jgi:hypothetical protein
MYVSRYHFARTFVLLKFEIIRLCLRFQKNAKTDGKYKGPNLICEALLSRSNRVYPRPVLLLLLLLCGLL